MTIEVPNNQQLFHKLTPFEQSEYIAALKGMNQIADKNPGMDTKIYTRFLHDYLEAGVEHRKILDDYGNRAKNAGVVPDQRAIDMQSLALRNQFVDKFVRETIPQHGESGRQTWLKFANHMRPKTIPGAIVDQFYNEEKGGLQPAGIIGGALAGLYIFNQLGGLSGGILGGIGTVLAVAAGAWLANGAADTISQIWNKNKEDKQQLVIIEKEKAPVQEKAKEQKPQLPNIQLPYGVSLPGALFEVKDVKQNDAPAPTPNVKSSEKAVSPADKNGQER